MKILLRNDSSRKWETVEAAEYSAEQELQRLLAEDPSLISLQEVREDAKPLLVGVREVGLPGSGSTDIMAFSPDGDIAIIECKLAANAEIKRKVVGQILEYGAFLWGMRYEDLNELISRKTNADLADWVGNACTSLGIPDWDEEGFRNNIQERLSDGSFILIIAVDEMNEELSRTIRFLNGCGSPSFVFTALEMRRFQKGKTEILVPHLFETGPSKTTEIHRRPQWTKTEFFEAAKNALSPGKSEIIQDLYDWARAKADRVWFGTGKELGSFTFHYFQNKKTVSVFSIYTNGDFFLNYGYLSQQMDRGLLEWFHQELIRTPIFANVPADFNKFPSLTIDEEWISQPESIQRIQNDCGRIKGLFGPGAFAWVKWLMSR